MITPFQDHKHTLLLLILVFSLFLKLFIDGFVEINKADVYIKSVNFHKQFVTYMNCDDIEMASVARNVLLGKGFVTDISYDRPKFRPEATWPTAFRPRLNVLAHVLGLRVYTIIHPEYDIAQSSNIPELYFEKFAETIFILKNILFIISLFYFYRLATLFLSQSAALSSTLLYCIYPSIILYVGIMNIFECIIMPCLIIIISIHLYNRRYNKKFSFLEMAFFCHRNTDYLFF